MCSRMRINLILLLSIVCLLMSACNENTAPTETVPVTIETAGIAATTPDDVIPSTTAPVTEPIPTPTTDPTDPAPVVHSIDMEELAGGTGMWCEVCEDGKVIARFYQCAFPVQYSFENITPVDSWDVSDISSWIRYYREDGTVEVILYAGDIVKCTVDGSTAWYLSEAMPKYDWLTQNMKSTIRRVNEPIRVDYSVYSEWDYNEVHGEGLGQEQTPGSTTTRQAEEFLDTIGEQVSGLGTEEWDVASLADLFLRCTSAVDILDMKDFDWSVFTTEDASRSIGIQALMKIKGGYFFWRMDRNFQPAVVFIDGDRAMAYDNNIEIYFRLQNGRWFVEDVIRPCSR